MSQSPFSTEAMRKRFWELTGQVDQVRQKAGPLRAKYEALRHQQCEIDKQLAPIIADMKQAEAPLFEMDKERAALARALNGKTGPRQ